MQFSKEFNFHDTESIQISDKENEKKNEILSLKCFSDEEAESKPRQKVRFNTFKNLHQININPFLRQYCKSTSMSVSSEEQKTPADEIFSSFKPIKTIGQGAHSIVKLVKHQDGNHYAAKILKRSNDEEIVEQAKDEYFLLKKINHENIIKAHYMLHNTNLESFAILLELFKGRPLSKKKFYSISNIQNILKQLLQTIVYLHQENIVHRDISIGNVLYNPETQKIKLIDFGCAKQQKTPNDVMCTPVDSGYSAPEQSEGGVYHNKVDIWSVGQILYYLITGKNIDKNEFLNFFIFYLTISLLDIILNDKFNKIECKSIELLDLLKQLLLIDENQRITAKEALNHEFFSIQF